MADPQQIHQAIDQIIKSLYNFKKVLDGGNSTMDQLEVVSKAPTKEEIENFESLKKALMTDKWPEAVNPNLICQPDNENDKLERGRGIIELMVEDELKGLKVLDYGCGEGQCVIIGSEYEPTIAVGYDIKSYDTWEKYKKDNTLYTTEFQTVIDNGPYDVIILFDVIDHVKEETPESVLMKVRGLLSENGKVYMRCHPFISKHGTHLYHSLNKAYVHLVFTPEELKQIIPYPKFSEDSIGVIYPLRTYEKFIEDAGLDVVSRREMTSKVEPFFKIPKIAERIIKTAGTEAFPEFQMGLDFVDYVLSK